MIMTEILTEWNNGGEVDFHVSSAKIDLRC